MCFGKSEIFFALQIPSWKLFAKVLFPLLQKTSIAKILSEKLIQRKENKKSPNKKISAVIKNSVENNFTEDQKKFALARIFFAYQENKICDSRFSI